MKCTCTVTGLVEWGILQYRTGNWKLLYCCMNSLCRTDWNNGLVDVLSSDAGREIQDMKLQLLYCSILIEIIIIFWSAVNQQAESYEWESILYT